MRSQENENKATERDFIGKICGKFTEALLVQVNEWINSDNYCSP